MQSISDGPGIPESGFENFGNSVPRRHIIRYDPFHSTSSSEREPNNPVNQPQWESKTAYFQFAQCSILSLCLVVEKRNVYEPHFLHCMCTIQILLNPHLHREAGAMRSSPRGYLLQCKIIFPMNTWPETGLDFGLYF